MSLYNRKPQQVLSFSSVFTRFFTSESNRHQLEKIFDLIISCVPIHISYSVGKVNIYYLHNNAPTTGKTHCDTEENLKYTLSYNYIWMIKNTNFVQENRI